MTTDLVKVLEKHQEWIMQRRHVVGVGIGEKYVAGKNTHQPCLTVFVDRKVPLSSLSEEERIPSEIEEQPLDVIESGRFRPLV